MIFGHSNIRRMGLLNKDIFCEFFAVRSLGNLVVAKVLPLRMAGGDMLDVRNSPRRLRRVALLLAESRAGGARADKPRPTPELPRQHEGQRFPPAGNVC